MQATEGQDSRVMRRPAASRSTECKRSTRYSYRNMADMLTPEGNVWPCKLAAVPLNANHLTVHCSDREAR